MAALLMFITVLVTVASANYVRIPLPGDISLPPNVIENNFRITQDFFCGSAYSKGPFPRPEKFSVPEHAYHFFMAANLHPNFDEFLNKLCFGVEFRKNYVDLRKCVIDYVWDWAPCGSIMIGYLSWYFPSGFTYESFTEKDVNTFCGIDWLAIYNCSRSATDKRCPNSRIILDDFREGIVDGLCSPELDVTTDGTAISNAQQLCLCVVAIVALLSAVTFNLVNVN